VLVKRATAHKKTSANFFIQIREKFKIFWMIKKKLSIFECQIRSQKLWMEKIRWNDLEFFVWFFFTSSQFSLVEMPELRKSERIGPGLPTRGTKSFF
jgi:hypothetical protein